MKRKLTISLVLALMLTLLIAVGAMAAKEKLTLGYNRTGVVGFPLNAYVFWEGKGATGFRIESGVTFSVKPANKATVDPNTGVLNATKPCTAVVTAKYVTPLGKAVKGSMKVVFKANEYREKIDKRYWNDGELEYIPATKRRYYKDDHLYEEMYIYNYTGSTITLGDLNRWTAYLSDIDAFKRTDLFTPVRYVGCNAKTRVKNKARFTVEYRIPLSTCTWARGQNLRKGHLGMVLWES